MSDKKDEIGFWCTVIWIWSFSCFAIGSAAAAVNNPTPTSGQTVTVETSPPNPDTTGVHAVAGSINVTVNILPGGQINVANNTSVVIQDQSQISNQGAITNTASLGFDGVDFGSNNTITNAAQSLPRDFSPRACSQPAATMLC
jgi:hypothetical protein